MNGIKQWLKKYWVYLVALALPWGLVIVYCFYSDNWLTGNGSLLRGDMNAQLVPFYYALWDKIHLGDDMSYTWNVAGGADFSAISGYLMSPFSLLVLILPRNCIVDVVQFIMVMKWALVSVTMVYFFLHTKHNTLTVHKREVSLFLGLAYGMGSGMLNFMGYIQFNDLMICFPVLLLLVEKMVKNKSWKLYFIVLYFCILTNTYMAFGVCLFLIIWFFTQFDEHTAEKGKKFFIFAGSSIFVALASAQTIVGGLMLSQSRLETEGDDSLREYVYSFLIHPAKFIEQLFFLEPIAMPNDRDPNIYFTVAGVVLVMLFLFIQLNKKKKVYLLSMAMLMIASFFVGILSIVWHCFAIPNGVYHRFSNLYVFLMLFMVLYVFKYLETIQLKHVIILGIIEAVIFVYTFFNITTYNSVAVYLGTILLGALYTILLVLYCKKSITYSKIVLAFVIIGIVELSVNTFVTLECYDADTFLTEQKNAPVIELSKDLELDGGERLVCAQSTPNIGLLIGKNTDSGFLSSINGNNLYYHTRLGMTYNGRVSYGISGGSPLINLLFNTRYGIGNNEMLFSDAELIKEYDDFALYEMQRLAGIGFMVESSIADWEIAHGTCFDVQNKFVQSAVGETDIFKPIKTKMYCENATGESVEVNHDLAEYGTYVCMYDYETGTDNDTVMVEFVVDKDMDLYMYTMHTTGPSISVFIDDEIMYGDTLTNAQQTLHIGNVKKGQKISVCAVPKAYKAKGTEVGWVLSFAEFDNDAYSKVYKKLSKNVLQVEEEKANYIKGKICVDKKGIMMTSIQAAEGFEVYVDGEQVEYAMIANTMIGVVLEKGEHTVEFLYNTPKSLMCSMISYCSIIVYIVICLMDFKKRRNAGRNLIEEM